MENRKTILLVDDEDEILLSLQRILELSGNYEIITAKNGSDALLKIRSTMPDMIISDIHMPEMDGIELCKRIRGKEVTKNIPFLFLTAVKDMMLESFKVGADDFIKKPFLLDEVMAKIQAIFRRVDAVKQQANQINGSLNEYSLEKILESCHKENLTGVIIMQQNELLGRIELEGGDIKKIQYKDLAETEALDQLLKWQTGIFVIQTQGVELKPVILEDLPSAKGGNRLEDSVEIAENVWWSGHINPDSLLQINTYLRRFRKENKVINFLIDPGPPADFPEVSAKLSRLIGDTSRIHIYSLNNQNPDVCLSAVFIGRANTKAVCLTSEENWRLISHYGIEPQSVKLINTFQEGRIKLSTGQELVFTAAPFCRAKGAFLTYDPESRVLFSGDLFSGISDAGRISELYAGEEDWDGIRAFHQMYIPANKALRNAIDQIRKIDPPPLLIAPRQGLLLRGKIMQRFIDRVYNLDTGVDLLNAEDELYDFSEYQTVCNDLINETASLVPFDKINASIEEHPSLLAMCNYKDGKIERIFSRPAEMLENLVQALISGEENSLANQIKTAALKAAHAGGLPAPHLDWDNEPTLTITPKHLFDD